MSPADEPTLQVRCVYIGLREKACVGVVVFCSRFGVQGLGFKTSDLDLWPSNGLRGPQVRQTAEGHSEGNYEGS